MSGVRVLCADWLVPVDAPPIEGGAVAIEHGEILAVGPARDLIAAHPAHASSATRGA